MNGAEKPAIRLNLATDSDVKVLLLLQDAFHTYNIPEKRDYSFAYEITNDPFTEADFLNIVKKEECVLLMDGEIPVGYMLIDSCSSTQALKDYIHSIERLIQDDYLDKAHRLAPRYVEALNPGLYKEENQELKWQMFLYLIYHNREKYDTLLYAFFTNAGILMEKLNMGWKIAYDNGMYFYMVWEINEFLKKE